MTAANAMARPVIHVYSTMLDLGGVESLLAVHRRWEPALGVDPWFRMLFDRRAAPADTRYHNFNFHGWQSLGSLRREFARELAARPGSTVIYHHGWWLPFLAPLDGAARRLVFLHGDQSYYRTFLPALRGLVDGVLCDSPLTLERLEGSLPGMDATRRLAPPIPIERPPDPGPGAGRREGDELVLGYPGRLRRDQKRLDRLPAFLSALRARRVKFRFELMGEGVFGPALQRQLRDWPEVRFLGRKQGEDYWQQLASWDAAVWFSDSEAGPFALLEAMAVGTLVFYPRLGESLGDIYTPRLDPRCHYRAGDPVAAADAVCAVLADTGDELAALRARAAALMAGRTAEGYAQSCVDFYQHIAAMPRLSAVATGVRLNPFLDRLPMGVGTRLGPRFMHRAWPALA
jgi:glycosyltransferase involved in cell wall biosynthesis